GPHTMPASFRSPPSHRDSTKGGSTMSYLTRFTRRPTGQREQLAAGQVPNSEVGFVWQVDRWTQLRRFLVLGSEGGSFYARELDLTKQNTRTIDDCIAEDGLRTVAEIVAVSQAGRAVKSDPAVFALARCASAPDVATRRAAL